MPKKRTLADLYVRGKELTLDDGAGEPVSVWLQKLNNIDHEVAVRRADAARARVLASAKDRDSDEYLSIATKVLEIDSPAALIAQLTAQEQARIAAAEEAKLELEKEWSDDNYLQGLRDAWTNGLADRFIEDEEDAEAAHVFAELKRFNEEASARISDEIAVLVDAYSNHTTDALRELVIPVFIKAAADTAWLREFYRCEVWLGVRQPQAHRERYFGPRQEVDQVDAQVYIALSNGMRSLTVDPVEGKGLGGTPTSSDSSDQPVEQPATPSLAAA